MKRRDFLKLAGLGLLGFFTPQIPQKGSGTMLAANTSRYGDILREFYQGIKDGTLSEVRLSEIQRIFNELSDRETNYQSWLRGGHKNDPRFGTVYADRVVVGKAAVQGIAVRVKRDNTQAIADNTDTYIQFESKGYDDANFVDLVANSTLITIPETGRYLINFFVRFDGNVTGLRSAIIERNGTNFAPIDHRMGVTGAITNCAGYDERYLSQGDTLKLKVKQTSGGSLDIINGAVLVRQVRTTEYPGEPEA